MNSTKTTTKAHIYLFVEKNKKKKPLTEKIFYVGSSIHVSQRVEEHIKAYIMTQQNNIDREVYLYLANTVGIHQFDVYILDNSVPAELLKTYERLYYDALMNLRCNLQNTYKPVPENLEFTKDQTNISQAQRVINEFQAKLQTNNEMTQEEVMINDMKKYCILHFVGKHNSPDQPEITRLKQQVKELKQENKSLKDSNQLLVSENKLLKDFNECLKRHEEHGQSNMKEDESAKSTNENDKKEQFKQVIIETTKESSSLKQKESNIISNKDLLQNFVNQSDTNNKDKHKNINKLLKEQGRKKCHMCDNIYSLTNISKHYKICPGYSVDQLMKKIEQLESQSKGMHTRFEYRE
tara:strand:+ start:1823 stop:2875 length:1053 start_codon:yes stop_codon:yes gene_type:complete